MIAIRLQRRGRKNDPSFRVVVVDHHSGPKTGKYIEMVGSYDPRVDRVDLKADRILHWLSQGAQASGTVHNLLVSQKVIDAKKVNVLPKKTVAPAPSEVEVKKEGPVAAPVAEAPKEEVAAVEESAPAQEETPAEAEAVAPVSSEVASEEPTA